MIGIRYVQTEAAGDIAARGAAAAQSRAAACDQRHLISNDQAELERSAGAAEIIVVSGEAGKSLDLPRIWQHATSVRWVHSLSAGVERLLFPALVDSSCAR